MPYLPVAIEKLNDAVFPTVAGADLSMAVSLIEERWLRCYPEIVYYSMLKAQAAMVDLNTPVGTPGSTYMDPLYRESVPQSVGVAGAWAQPHNNVTHNATDRNRFVPSFNVNAQVFREARDNELKRWGFDRFRDLIVTIPVSLFDRVATEAKPGDEFTWDGEGYTVLQSSTDGYWLNTNVRLYVVLNCQHGRSGS